MVVEMPVAWGEMDAYGHVNNTVYFRYFEQARIAYLERIGFTDEALRGGVGPILASTHCRFRHPLRYPDRVLSATRVTEVAEDRFVMEYRVVSDGARRGGGGGGGRGGRLRLPRGARPGFPRPCCGRYAAWREGGDGRLFAAAGTLYSL